MCLTRPRVILYSLTLPTLQIALVLALWGFGLPAIMNPDNEIAVRAVEVDNANLYFSSWISFAAAVFCEYLLYHFDYSIMEL